MVAASGLSASPPSCDARQERVNSFLPPLLVCEPLTSGLCPVVKKIGTGDWI